MPRKTFKTNTKKKPKATEEAVSSYDGSSSFQSVSTPTDLNLTSASRTNNKQLQRSPTRRLETSRSPTKGLEASRSSRRRSRSTNRINPTTSRALNDTPRSRINATNSSPSQSIVPGTSRSQREQLSSKVSIVMARSPQESHRILTEILNSSVTTSNNQTRRKQKKPKRKIQSKVVQAITQLQKTTNSLIPLAPFLRLVREIFLQFKPDVRLTKTTVECLHESAEIYLVQLLEDSYKCTLHRQRVTLQPIDMQLVRQLRGLKDPGSNF